MNYKVTQDREDEQEVEVTKEFATSVDKDAAWLKKGGKYRFGYKNIMLQIMKVWF